ncbi:hypothetical protein B566_EDAN013484 [Ephemera danica]|nr:hypothetical protein B566_EDAN013484 [Ephemera danica]
MPNLNGSCLVLQSMGMAEMEVEPATLEEARGVLRDLRERHRNQAHQILSWRRRAKAQNDVIEIVSYISQEELLARLARDHAEQLRGLSSQLLLFEARLCRRQKDIRMLLSSRENCISRQARTIRALQARPELYLIMLSEAGLDATLPDSEDSDSNTITGLGGGDNDSDSAVIMEDGSAMDLQLVLPLSSVLRYNSANAAVQRSISDATKFSSSGAGGKRGSNSFLRRPEILETVYSVEEDQDGDVVPTPDTSTTSAEPTPRRTCLSDSDDFRTAPDTESEDVSLL